MRQGRNHSREVGGDLACGGCLPIHFTFSSSVPFPSSLIAPPTFHPFPYTLLHSPGKFGHEVCGSTVSLPQCTAGCRSWRGPNRLGRHALSPQLEGPRPASHVGRLRLCVRVLLLRFVVDVDRRQPACRRRQGRRTVFTARRAASPTLGNPRVTSSVTLSDRQVPPVSGGGSVCPLCAPLE